jgi:hypothetical protein
MDDFDIVVFVLSFNDSREGKGVKGESIIC